MINVKVIDDAIGEDTERIFSYNDLIEITQDWYCGKHIPSNDAKVLDFNCEEHPDWNSDWQTEIQNKNFNNLMEFCQKKMGFIMIENFIKIFIDKYEREQLVLWYGEDHIGLSKKMEQCLHHLFPRH